jgi:hypothetical protein
VTINPTADAARARRYRHRRKLGVQMLTIEVSQKLIDALVATGRLAERDSSNAQRVTSVIQSLITQRVGTG